MDATSREVLWGQFGGAIDMLENAIRACPDALWSDRDRRPEFWYLAYHLLLRQAADSAPEWVTTSRSALHGE